MKFCCDPSKNRRRRAAWLLSIALAGSPIACSGDQPQVINEAARPDLETTDVLWLTLCTLRADFVGAYGSKRGVTPELDLLAERGIRFEEVLTVAPWTRPSIAAQITGKYPRTLALDVAREITDEDRASCCPDAGLRSLAEEFTTAAEYFSEHGYLTIGVSGNPNASAAFGFDQGFRHFSGTGDLHWSSGYGSRKLTAQQINSRFLAWLPASDERFFAHLTYVDVHPPRILPGSSDPSGRPRPMSYAAALLELDRSLAELLRELEQRGREDLLVVVSSDHGEGLLSGPDGRWGHGPHLYQEHLRSIWLMTHPALPQRSLGGRVESVDILPTVLRLLGAEIPSGIEGRSHAAAISNGENLESRSIQVAETAFGGTLRGSIIAGNHKLIASSGVSAGASEGENSLFDLDTDPGEGEDLASRMPDRVADLKAQLEGWRTNHPPEVDRRATASELDESTERQLEALGYAK